MRKRNLKQEIEYAKCNKFNQEQMKIIDNLLKIAKRNQTLTLLDEFEKMIDEIENPYPEDIFPKLSEEEINLVKVILKRNSIISMDRLSADLMRRARETLKEELKSEIKEMK